MRSPAPRRTTYVPAFVRRSPRFNSRTAEVVGIDGDCLRPWFLDGDLVWYDRTLEPLDRDLVLAEMRFISDDESEIELRPAIKQLRIINGERFLCCTDAWIEADWHTVVASVVGWHRSNWWRRPSVKHMRYCEPELQPKVSPVRSSSTAPIEIDVPGARLFLHQ